MGCTTCVERAPGAAEAPVDLDVRPSLREHSLPDTADAVDDAALIAEPVRAGILAILRDGPHCVCEMAAALDLSTATVKRHWSFVRAWLSRELRQGETEATKK